MDEGYKSPPPAELAWSWANFIQNVGAPVAIAIVIVWFGYQKLDHEDQTIAQIETTLAQRNEIFRNIIDNQNTIKDAESKQMVALALMDKEIQDARILAATDWNQLQRMLDQCVAAHHDDKTRRSP